MCIYSYSKLNYRHDSTYYSLVCQHCRKCTLCEICPTNAMTAGVKTERLYRMWLVVLFVRWCNYYFESVAENVTSVCPDREERSCLCKHVPKELFQLLILQKSKLKIQEKYLAKLAGEYDIGSTSNRSFVHFILMLQESRLALDE